MTLHDKLYVIALVLAHFVGDWFLQSRAMARAKSRDLSVLLTHVARVTACIALVSIPFRLPDIDNVAMALLWYAVIHGLQDWFGWRWYGRVYGHLSDAGHFRNPAWYSTVAMDQALHLIVLFALFL